MREVPNEALVMFVKVCSVTVVVKLVQFVPFHSARLAWRRKVKPLPHTFESSSVTLASGEISVKNSSSFSMLCNTHTPHATHTSIQNVLVSSEDSWRAGVLLQSSAEMLSSGTEGDRVVALMISYRQVVDALGEGSYLPHRPLRVLHLQTQAAHSTTLHLHSKEYKSNVSH